MSLISSPRYKSKTDKTLVMDMDETLVSCNVIEETEKNPLEEIEYIYDDHTLYDIKARSFRVPFYDPFEKVGTGAKYDCWGIKRPHLDEFLVFAFDYFKNVVLWSAGRKSYVKKVAKEITRDTHSFDLVWTYHDCTNEGMGKPLNKLLKTHPELGGIDKIFIIDDKESSVEDNKRNGIVIPAYSPELTPESLRNDETSLLELKKWFLRKEVVEAKDVRKLKKNRIFQ